MTATYPRNGHDPNHTRDEHVLVSIAMSPFRWTQRTYRHLSSRNGIGIVGSLMCAYCAALSVEALFIAIPNGVTPGAYSEEEMASRRFVLKPFVDDGADPARMLPPVRQVVHAVAPEWVPAIIKGNGEYRWTIWHSPMALGLAVLGAVVIQYYEAKIWRKRSLQETLDKFREANNTKKVEADPKALAVAQYHAQQHNLQGTGSVTGTFLAVVALYGSELAAFGGSFAGSSNGLVTLLYAFLTICGFEVFDRISDEVGEEGE